MERERLYEPEWGNVIYLYAVKYLRRHEWRVRPYVELDDLLQEAWITFEKLKARYEFKSPSHFMAMWKCALHNLVLNAAQARTRRREVMFSEEANRGGVHKDFDNFEWADHLRGAPGPVKQLLRAAASRRGRRPAHRRIGLKRETTNHYLCRMAGLSGAVPLRRLFENWLYLKGSANES